MGLSLNGLKSQIIYFLKKTNNQKKKKKLTHQLLKLTCDTILAEKYFFTYRLCCII